MERTKPFKLVVLVFTMVMLFCLFLCEATAKDFSQTPTPDPNGINYSDWESLSISFLQFLGPDYPEQNNKEIDFDEKLYRTSLEFVAKTPNEADSIAQKIGFAGSKYESASTACGPLSIAILKNAGLLPPSASLHDIWLLCTRERPDCDGLSILQRKYFSPEDYDYIFIKESVSTYDFTSNPLQAADWLYLYVARNGFDHMLTVTRVDENGAAYTVTNLDRGEGFLISEELLYDPTKSGKGLFYELTDLHRSDPKVNLGNSGDGGFLLIRRKITPPLQNQMKKCVID